MPEETRFGYLENMPQHIRELFLELCDEVINLNLRWQFLSELFGKQENAALLANVASASFDVIGNALGEVIIMSICRLSDGLQYRDRPRLTLQRLINSCPGIPDSDKLWTDFSSACKPFREHRNMKFGHYDLKTTLSPHENPLPSIGRAEVEEVLQIAATVLKGVYRRYSSGDIAIVSPHHIGGADTLIYWIKAGYEAERRTHGLDPS
jgi:AbiU2